MNPQTIPFGSKPIAPMPKTVPFGAAPFVAPTQSQTVVPTIPEKKKNTLFDIFTSSTQKFGKTTGEALAAPANTKLFSENMESHSKIQNDLQNRIREKKLKGEDVSRLENTLKMHTGSAPTQEQYTGDVINKTAGQILGEAAGTVLEAMTGGSLSSAKAVVTSKALSGAQKVKEAAKVGAQYGAVGGAANAMQEGGDIADTVMGAGKGALFGGALGGAVGAVAPKVASSKLFMNDIEKETAKFGKKLKNAEESIYTTLTKAEKETGALKQKGSKSVVDLQNDPKTKPIIESVANMPDDIQIKPTDKLTVRDSKLRQGISRLHQSTSNNLARPEIKASTQFDPQKYDSFMKERVLDPIESEFGKASKEYADATKGIKISKETISERNAYGVHTGRQKFDAEFKKKNPRAFKLQKTLFGQLDPNITNTVENGRNIRNAMNDFTESLLPENHPFRFNLREESNLLTALREMRKRSTKELDKNSLARFLDRNPKTAKVVDSAATALKLGGGLSLFK